MDGIVSIIASAIILLISGLFVSFFIGDRIILSGLKKEKKLEEKTKEELESEINVVNEMKQKIDKIEEGMEEIKNSLSGGVCHQDTKTQQNQDKNTDIYN